MNRKIVTALVALVLIVAGAYLYLSGQEHVVRITESEIRDTLDKTLPLTKSYFLVIQITLTNPRVHLENGSDRVRAGLDVLLNLKLDQGSEPLGASVDVSGGIRYQAQDGAFFLTDPTIEKLEAQGVPDDYAEQVNRALTQFLSSYFEENPVHTLDPTDGKQAVARMVLKDVVVENKELVLTLGL